MDGGEDPVNLYMTLGPWPGIPNTEAEIIGGSGSGGDDDTEVDLEELRVGENYLLGFIIANIVGVQHYTGTITGREMVGLIREPLNPHDENAIKVINIRAIQVGNIERSVAAVLSPLLDQNLISMEGIVPNTPGRRNNQNRYKIPCQIHIFATANNFDVVYSAVIRGGLQLIRTDDHGFGLSGAAIVGRHIAVDERKRLNDILKLVDEKVPTEAMEPPKEVIKSELFLHQKVGLAWLVEKENSGDMPPFWVEKEDGMFYNELSGYTVNYRPRPLRGGILADDMGMGKTLTLLCLIALDKFDPAVNSSDGSGSGSGGANICESNGENDEDEGCVIFGGKNPKKGRGVKMVNNLKKRPRCVDKKSNELCCSGPSVNVVGSKTTLVVCPPSVFSTWIDQLGDHTKPGRLKVYLYYGDRTDNPAELNKFDLVLTTYTTLAGEDSSESPMFKVEWWRVILDEAHTIKNVKARQSRAVNKLHANRRWLVTGTPIQNGTTDLFSFMTFLRFDPFSNKNYWTTLVQRPIANGEECGLSRLQAVMSTITLRRTKEKGLTDLPPKIIEICYVDLSSEDRELYDRMEVEAKSVVRDYISANRVTRNYTTVLSIILRLRQICTDVALCPTDLIASLPASTLEDLSNNPELLKKMVAMLEDGEDFDCPICISTPTNIVITRCAHIYCKACILKTLKRAKPCCPLCRKKLSESDLFSAPAEVGENSEVVSSSKSAKVSAVLQLLSASRDQDPFTKSVIFSQFRKMLILLEEPLQKAGFKILRLDGSMNATRRAQVIREFGETAPDGPTILLASLKASGTGVNLTAASRVYLLEPWWNPAVEEQAMDRVHRIGQSKEVRIVRMIARNTIEERILELQAKKKRVATKAFDKKGGSKERGEISIDDIRTLISLTNRDRSR